MAELHLMKKQGLWLTILKIGMWVGLAQGAIFSLAAVGFALNTTIFLARSIRAEGKVIALVHIEDGDEDTTYRPVFTFVTRDGATQTVRSNAGSNPPGFELGENVPVRYKAADPSVARIDTFWQMWPFPVGICNWRMRNGTYWTSLPLESAKTAECAAQAKEDSIARSYVNGLSTLVQPSL